MARKLDYDLVKNAIEQAIQFENFHALDFLESQLLKLIVRVRVIIDNSVVPSLPDLELLGQLKMLHFLIVSVKN